MPRRGSGVTQTAKTSRVVEAWHCREGSVDASSFAAAARGHEAMGAELGEEASMLSFISGRDCVATGERRFDQDDQLSARGWAASASPGERQ